MKNSRIVRMRKSQSKLRSHRPHRMMVHHHSRMIRWIVEWHSHKWLQRQIELFIRSNLLSISRKFFWMWRNFRRISSTSTFRKYWRFVTLFRGFSGILSPSFVEITFSILDVSRWISRSNTATADFRAWASVFIGSIRRTMATFFTIIIQRRPAWRSITGVGAMENWWFFLTIAISYSFAFFIQ